MSFFVLAIITSGRVNPRFHHKKEGQTEVDWGVAICFRWGFLKECPSSRVPFPQPPIGSKQRTNLTRIAVRPPLVSFALKPKGIAE